MDKLQNDLETARSELQALNTELPQYRDLLADNEREQAKLKEDKAPIDALAQARGRVAVAKELLDQHEADIATAQAQVTRLEAQAARESRLSRMAQHAETALAHRTALESAVEEAAAGLQRTVEKIIREWNGYESAKAEFVSVGAEELGRVAWHNNPYALGLQGTDAQHLQEQVLSLLNTLKARGVDLSPLLEGEVVALPYRTDRPLPADGFAMLVWAAVLAHAETPHTLKRSAPQTKIPVPRITAPTGDRYTL